MIAYTDYPFESLGDVPGQLAPIRQVKISSYDGNKYCNIVIDDIDSYGHYEFFASIKSGYLYSQPGRCGEVESIDKKMLAKLIINKSNRRSYRKQLFKMRHNWKFWR